MQRTQKAARLISGVILIYLSGKIKAGLTGSHDPAIFPNGMIFIPFGVGPENLGSGRRKTDLINSPYKRGAALDVAI